MQWHLPGATHDPRSLHDCGQMASSQCSPRHPTKQLHTLLVALARLPRGDGKDGDASLIRALAVRTMGCIRVERITEYLCEPLQRCLRDDDPYVRKTAAICVAKLYDTSPGNVEERGFLDILRDLVAVQAKVGREALR